MRLILAALAVTLLAGCTSHRFIPTGDGPKMASKGPSCGATVLRRAPIGSYKELGICTAKAPGGGVISDNTPDAIAELQRCACEAGGNAILLESNTDQGLMTGFGASQMTVTAQGVVILRETP